MKKIIVLAVFVAVAIAVTFFFLKKSSGITGNTQILQEIERVEQLSLLDDEGKSHIKKEDLNALSALVEKDDLASGHVEDMILLIEKGKGDHVAHTLSLLRDYIKTGDESPCLPHELWHIGIFIENGEVEYAKEQIGDLQDDYKKWEESIELKKEKFPQYFKNLDTLKSQMQDAIAKLESGDFSEETLKQLDEIGEKGIC